MANGASAWATAINAAPTSRTSHPSWHSYHFNRKVRRDVVTLLGNEANGAYHDLASLQVEGAVLIPEQCVIRYGGSGTVNLTARLDKIDAAGAVTNLTGTVTVDATGIEVFAAAANTALPTLAATDKLRLTFPAVTTTTAGRLLLIELAFDIPHS